MNESTLRNYSQPNRFAAYTTSAVVHSAKSHGYTTSQHDRAMDRLLDDISKFEMDDARLDHTAGDQEIEPKIRLASQMTRTDLQPRLSADGEQWARLA